MAVIGFPRTLFYYTYWPFWNSFFQGLGLEVRRSSVTTKQILDNGVKETVTDACVPIKIYHGHVMALSDQIDYLFCPRMVSVDKFSTFCPKFLGLPEMIRYTLPNSFDIIEVNIDLKKGPLELWKICLSLAKDFGCSTSLALKSFHTSLLKQKAFFKLLYQGYQPEQAFAFLFEQAPLKSLPDKHKLNLAVLGYPYQVYDPYISVNLMEHLEKLGVKAWTMEMVPERKLRTYQHNLPKRLFWHYSNRVIWALYYYLEQEQIDGVIHVTAFGCGPDAMVDKLMELEIKRLAKHMPFMSLTIDEHSGEAGLVTRLEAFVDMILLGRKAS
ncbi:acyl-CoA dehydratase activase-related protein [Zhaonella formicivorans]|uniref:acyl-CoA dehydratase activase-related protein n=1 Tax=Zhaonella formicivorans TaxID=2528593 RepID=UPI0010D732BB|nr:acyl-CoA dehydratase activase-related protein [Zhaonella formicivorans]